MRIAPASAHEPDEDRTAESPWRRPEARWPVGHPLHVALPESRMIERASPVRADVRTLSGDLRCRVVLRLVEGPAHSHEVAAAVGATVVEVQAALCHLRDRRLASTGAKVRAANGRQVRTWRLGPEASRLVLLDGPRPGPLDVSGAVGVRPSAAPGEPAAVVKWRRRSPPGHVAAVVAAMLAAGESFTSADACELAGCGRTAVERALRDALEAGTAETCGNRRAGRGWATLWRARSAA